jgi:hypothetical protein
MISKIKTSLLISLLFCSLQLQAQIKTYKINSSQNAASEVPSGNSIDEVVAYGDTVLISSSGGFSYSFDRGASWTNTSGVAAFQGMSSSALGHYGNALWVATVHSVDANGETKTAGTGLRYSLDKGQTWSAVSQPLDDAGDSLIVYGINDGVHAKKIRALPVTTAVDNIIYDVAFTRGTLWIASYAGGLRKSTDMGKSWQRVLLPSDNLNSIKPTDTLSYSLQPVAGKFGSESYLNHRVFSVVSANDSTLYVGTADGINKSTDGGISWVKFNHLNQSSSISGNFVVALGYNKTDNTVWAATWVAANPDGTEFYGVSYTKDDGATWKTCLKNEKAHNFGFKNKEVMAACDNGVFRADDSYSSWITPNSVVDKSTGIVLPNSEAYAAASEGNDVWIGTSSGLAKSDETGASMWCGTWNVFLSSPLLKSKSETYAFPNPFSPETEKLKIKYTTGGKRANVSIRIFDFGMNLVRTVIENAERGSQIHTVDGFNNETTSGVIDYWDGRDDRGILVPNGVYFYRIDTGSDEPVYGKVIVIK